MNIFFAQKSSILFGVGCLVIFKEKKYQNQKIIYFSFICMMNKKICEKLKTNFEIVMFQISKKEKL